MQLPSTECDDEEANCPLVETKESNKDDNKEISEIFKTSTSRQTSLTLNRKRNFTDIGISNSDNIFIGPHFKSRATSSKTLGINLRRSIDVKKKLSLVQRKNSSLESIINEPYIVLQCVDDSEEICEDPNLDKLDITEKYIGELNGKTYKNRILDIGRLKSLSLTVKKSSAEQEKENQNLIEATADSGSLKSRQKLACENICDIPKRKTVSRKRNLSIKKSTRNKRSKKVENLCDATLKISTTTQNTFSKTLQDSTVHNRYKLSLGQTNSTTILPSSNQTNDKKRSEYISDTCTKPNELNRFISEHQMKSVIDMSMHDYRLFPEDASGVFGNGLLQRASHNISNDDSTVGYYNNLPMSSPHQCMATLCNIGNTCYLNSVVYTLRFAPQFLHNLHHLVEDLSYVYKTVSKNRAKSSSLGRNINSFHSENSRSLSSRDLASHDNTFCDAQKTKQQIATEKLHELYQNLNKNERIESLEPFHADCFLRAIQEVSSIFEGNQQQDAHEFLMCVLDSIRETCLELTKAIAEYPDVIANGHISLAEQPSIQPSVTKEQETPPRQTTNPVSTKSSFFFRKKRKDCNKDAKTNQTSASVKENVPMTITDLSPESSPASNNKNNFIAKSSTNENDIWYNDKEQLNEKIKKLGLDFFSEDFEGITVSSTKCLSCETVTEQKETMIDIAVPITNNENTNLTDKFIQNSCITRENFGGDNKYRCEKCVGYTEAIRSISYEVLPRLLIIQLSRFSGGMEKISRYTPTPFTLQCFCAKCCELEENKKLHVYKLYSVITHVGATMSVGHYVAYTCYLDLANDYVNCNKNAKRQTNLNFANASTASTNNISTNASSNNSNSGEKNIALMKKRLFGRNKASSSGDMSKVKNSLPTKIYSNDLGKTNKNPTCDSYNCCGIRAKSNNTYNQTNLCNNATNNSIFPEMGDDTPSQYMYNHNAYFESAANRNNMSKQQHKTQSSEPTWYMCDDDKIKAMSQREFEELLSPSRKIMITPYLLFYARSQMQ